MTDPYVIRPGTLPTPFSAGEIRDATTPGMTLLVRTTSSEGASTYRRITFVSVDLLDAERETVTCSAAGVAQGETHVEHSTWRQLQEHAAFDSSSATYRDEARDTPMGWLNCRRYDVRRPEGTALFWFAREYPGMPFVYEHRDSDLVAQTLVEVLSIQHGPAPD